MIYYFIKAVKRTTGFEPATPTMARLYSTTELRSQSNKALCEKEMTFLT